MKCLSSVLLIAIFGIASVCCANTKVRFDNYHVYQLNPQTRRQLEAIKKLESSVGSYIFLDGVHYLNSKINVIVAPQTVPNFVKSLVKNFIPFELLDTNAQASLGDDEVADPNRRTADYTWDKYHQLNDTYNWLYSLEAKFKEVEVVQAGETYEGRKILALKISYGPGKKAIFLEAGIHAREWIAPATATYIAYQLLTSQDEEVRMIAENFDWYIIPHANPDGYVYTHTTNRAWRKTRSVYGQCFGADPNRNWGFHWNEVGASKEPCSDTYAGPSAFSEIEVKTLANYMKNFKDKMVAYISFHSYSQLLLFPYGHTGDLPPNYDELKRVYDIAVKAVGERYGTKYVGGNIHDAIYPAAGSSVDHNYAENNVKFAYCYELRPSKNAFWTGFKLPANQIIPTGEETLDSLKAMIKAIGVISFL